MSEHDDRYSFPDATNPPSPVQEPSSSLLPAIAAGVVAALVGGIVWGLIAKFSDYEIGIVAWGIGCLAGTAVVFATRGAKGLPLQAIAIVSALARHPARQVPRLRVRDPGAGRRGRRQHRPLLERDDRPSSARTSSTSSGSSTCSGSGSPCSRPGGSRSRTRHRGAPAEAPRSRRSRGRSSPGTAGGTPRPARTCPPGRPPSRSASRTAPAPAPSTRQRLPPARASG